MLVLHAHPSSSLALKLRKILALKGCAYGLTENGDPFDKGEAGIYIQWGRRFFSGAQLATLALEAASPEPTLFPNGNNGMPLALGFWSAHAIRASKQNSETLLAHAQLLARQLADGRPFLQGTRPGLADVEGWFFLTSCPAIRRPDAHLAAWHRRVHALGLGAAQTMTLTDCAAIPEEKAAQTLKLGPLARDERFDHPVLGTGNLAYPLL
ncbi:hypothetical protein JCM17844_21130 [Iodidimonas gelatinilytica]|uniref:Glutathione S-transferase n=1 Tax=Iodidimonas gelatinilytica TaxID=1236966 RepID=A0A5A7MRV5_9PROT|nr:hypothetical protein [Iodidimonas gelatinilytica]GEQ98476.1 hypothetical protein JCM17844_21130 [Iodidimonas gelatinilytica]